MDTQNTNRFGIEIETVGLPRHHVTATIATAIPESRQQGDSVVMADGRTWNVVRDGSLSGGESNAGEIVSPILTYADMDTLQNIVRAVRAAGARADDSCGIHVHVDGSRFTGRGLLNLVNIVCKNERLLERGIGVSARRLQSYTKAIDMDFLNRLDGVREPSVEALRTAWYGRYGTPNRYDSTRYHGLNLNSFFYRGTVEFRYFNGSLHAGEVKSYVQLCLALVHRAQTTRQSSRVRRVYVETNERWALRLLLKTIGMVGPEYKTARLHLTKHLQGNGSNPGRAVRAPSEG